MTLLDNEVMSCNSRGQTTTGSSTGLRSLEPSLWQRHHRGEAYIDNNLTSDIHSLQDFFQDVASKGGWQGAWASKTLVKTKNFSIPVVTNGPIDRFCTGSWNMLNPSVLGVLLARFPRSGRQLASGFRGLSRVFSLRFLRSSWSR